MQVISELVSGIRGAENGQAQIYKRASSTPATVYADYDGLVALAQPLTLDSFGGIECYVNEEVDVRAQDANGVVIRAFSPMQTANSVEYIGQSFTGHRYSDGFTGVQQPTSVQAILDLWVGSAGTTDFKVLVGGVDKTLQNAFASASIFINVKAPEYGAIGDGAADDTIAVQAALTAAAATKSIVIFPAGVYKITDKLTVPVDVSLWGLGSGASSLLLSHATKNLLEYGAGNSAGYQEIRGLSILATSAASGLFISMTNAGSRWIRMVNCAVLDASGHTGNQVSVDGSAGGRLVLEACEFVITNPNNTSSIIAVSNASSIEASGCLFFMTGVAGGVLCALINGFRVKAVRCTFDMSLVTAGVGVGVFLGNAAQQATFVANEFLPGAAGTTTGLSVGSNFAATTVFEAGNIFKAGFVANISGMQTDSNNPQYQNLNRDSRVQTIVDDSANVALNGHWYGTVVLRRTAAGGAQALTSTIGPPGATLVVIVYNNSGGALGADPSVNTGGFYAGNPAITKPADTKFSVAVFRSVFAAGGAAWVNISDRSAATQSF